MSSTALDAVRAKNAAPLPSTLLPAVVLGVALVAAKVILIGKPEDAGWWRQVVATTWEDVLFAAAYALAGTLALAAARGRPAVQLLLWRAFILIGAALVFFTVIHIGVYDWSRRALTIQMLRFAGDVKNLRSSVLERLTWPYAVGLPLVPLLFVMAFRRMRPRRAALGRFALGLALVWGLGGHWLLRHSGQEWLERMAQNPHLALASSVIQDWRGRAGATLPREFPPGDLADFQTVSERPGASSAQAGPARIRNVVVIVLESVGTRYLGLYGSPYDTTPNLVTEAKNSLVLDNFYANVGHTVCSFMVLNFSLQPGLPWCYVPCGERPLPPSLPELLGKQGYRTALLSSADMNYSGMAWAAEHHGYQTIKHYWDLGCPMLSSWGSEDKCLFDGVLRFIDEQPAAPFYVMAWTNQAHDPYVVSPGTGREFPGAKRADLGRYLSILRTIDAGMAGFLAGLRERGRDQDTLVVITGDHGEAFGEPHDYIGHGGVLYDEGVRVPFLMWNPAIFGGAGRSARVASHVDLNPTLAELLGVATPGGWQGRSLLDASRPDRAYFLTGLGEYLFGVRDGRYKYIYSASFGREHLYDLERDPDERVDISAREPALCRRERQRVAAWIHYEEDFLMGPAATVLGTSK